MDQTQTPYNPHTHPAWGAGRGGWEPHKAMAWMKTTCSRDEAGSQAHSDWGPYSRCWCWRCAGSEVLVPIRLATRACQARHNQAGLGPDEPCTRCNRFLLSSGCEWGKYYRVTHSTGPIPNQTQIPCRALVACLVLIPAQVLVSKLVPFRVSSMCSACVSLKAENVRWARSYGRRCCADCCQITPGA